MLHVKTYNKISDKGLRIFTPDLYTVSENTVNPDAIVVRSAPLNDLDLNPELKVIARAGAGFNTIPVDRCTAAGICVFNTPGGNANAVRELVIAAMISICRNVNAASEWMHNLKNGEWEYGKTVETGKDVFSGPELLGRQVGVIGVGAVGSRVAHACHALGMTVVGYDPYLTHLRRLELGQYIRFVDTIDELYETSDIVTVHTPLEPATEGLISREAIAKMKDGAYLINYARGPVVDNDAVCDALDSGKLRAFATDFATERELQRKDCYCTPHLGAATPDAEENCAVMAVRQAREYLENGNITNSVNFPDVSFARADGDRITILHKNKVGMLGVITERTAGMGLNIENLVNKARGDIAYTILDFNDTVPQALVEQLESITDVIRVRVIR